MHPALPMEARGGRRSQKKMSPAPMRSRQIRLLLLLEFRNALADGTQLLL